jgi:comEA protein
MFLRRIPIRFFLFSFLLSLIVSVPAAAGKKKPPAQPININTANSEQLQQVPGIGPATAEKILQMRKSYGPFKSVDDLLAIRGLGAKRLEKMRKYLTVGQPTPKKAPAGWAVPQILHNKKLQSPYRFPSWAMIA